MSEEAAIPNSEETSLESTIFDGIANRLVDVINSADEAAAAERVAQLRENKPNASSKELADQLIKQKCLKTGAVGAVTSGSALIPGLGTFASLTFGVAADIGMTFKLQAELVLEIAAAYGHKLTDAEKRTAVLTVTGISAGANQLLTAAGKQLSKEATERLVQQSALKALPIIGVGASAGVNLLTTYLIGQRAEAYFGLGPDKINDWNEGVRAIVGVDERKLADWLGEAARSSWTALSSGAASVGSGVTTVGKWLGGNIAAAGSGVAGGIAKAVTAANTAGQNLVGMFKKEKTADSTLASDPSVKGVVAVLKPDDVDEPELSETVRQAEKQAQEAEAGEPRGIFRIFNFNKEDEAATPLATECEDEPSEENDTIWQRIMSRFEKDAPSDAEAAVNDERSGIFSRLKQLVQRDDKEK